MTEIILRAKRFCDYDSYYILQYKIKDFVPTIIPPKNLFEKIIRKIFGNKYTKNNWKIIQDWAHVNYTKDNINIFGSEHPNKYWQELLIRFEELDKYKKRFKYLEDVEEYIKEEEKRYQESLKLYKEYQNKLKDTFEL